MTKLHCTHDRERLPQFWRKLDTKKLKFHCHIRSNGLKLS